MTQDQPSVGTMVLDLALILSYLGITVATVVNLAQGDMEMAIFFAIMMVHGRLILNERHLK